MIIALKVKKTPIPENERKRLAALRNYAILDSPAEGEFDRITQLASLICDMPISLLSFIDEDRQWFKSKVGMDQKETPRELTLCQFTIADAVFIEIEDVSRDKRYMDNELFITNPDVRFYAGYPLIDPNGYALGTLCVVDLKPNKLTDNQKKSMQLLAQEVIALVVERRQKEELKHFEQLFNLSNDLICITDSHGYFKKVNPAFERILGWDTESFLHATIFDLVHPDDHENTQLELLRLAAGQHTVNSVHRCKTRSNQYKTLQWTVTPEISTGFLFAIGRDITEETLNEKQLAISEEKLSAFFENSQGLMCTHDLRGKFLTFNHSGAEMLGYTQDEILKLTLFDLVTEDRADELSDYLNGLHEIGYLKGQMVLRNKNGSARVWTFNNVLARHSDSSAYVICNAIDVDERYHLVNDLKRTKEMLEETNKVARVGGWELDLRREKLYWTAITREIHGIGIDFKVDINNAIEFYKEGETREIISKAVKLAIEEGTPWDLELQIINQSGEEVWVRVIGQSEMVNGECKRIFGIFQDINEKKTAEMEIIASRKLTEDILHAASEVSIITTDLKGQITSFNSGAERLLGYPAREIIGKHRIGLFHLPEEMAQLAREFTTRNEEGVSNVFSSRLENVDSERREFTYVRKDGTHRLVSLIGTAIRNAKDEITGYLGIAIDITERKSIENALITAKEQAEQGSIAKSEFLANMSHEIRTPLNGVIGFTDLVLKTHLNETQAQYLSIVNQSANTLLGIINDILDFSKIEAGKLELEIEKFDLYEMACQATDIITYTIQSKGLEMLLNISSDLPRFIWSDAVRLKQILINLLGNAAKFTESGEIELKIEVLSFQAGQSRLRFGVRDTGIGIHLDKQDKIFEAFTQEDGSVTKKYGGTGLGLTISNKLLGLMGSQLQLKSRPGAGSFFYFDVNFKSEQGEAIEWGDIDLIKKVLVVDDNENNRLILNQMLLLKNIKTTEAKNGFDVLKKMAAGEQYDVILMDYQMPYMDGLDTIRRIRENFYPTAEEQPIVLLFSSAEDQEIIKACEELQVHHRLVKPVKIQDIYNILSKIYKKKDQLPAPPASTAAADPKTASLTILIAEDNLVNMLLAKTVIRRIIPNAFLLEAVNGREALEYCEAKFPDLILMDIQMPDMNGYEATMRIRALENMSHVPIIALTAGNLSSEKDRCLDAGMDDIIIKPFVEETMSMVLNKWVTL